MRTQRRSRFLHHCTEGGDEFLISFFFPLDQITVLPRLLSTVSIFFTILLYLTINWFLWRVFFSFFLMFHLLCTDGVNIYTINSLHFTPFHLSPTYSPISLPAVSAQSGVTLLLIIEDQRQCHRHLMVNYASRSIVSAPAHSLSLPPPTPHTLLDIYFRLFYHA